MHFIKCCKSVVWVMIMGLGLWENAKAQICNNQGNLFIFSNYDGGILNINVDVNIPDIKIGICTYEPVQVNITGAFKSNVTKVVYAGYYTTNNDHCKYGFTTSSISGVDNSITSIQVRPTVGYSNPNGWPNLICGVGNCNPSQSTGGCNTADQIVYYFQQATGGVLRSHDTRYGCWFNETLNLSTSGNCCITPSVVPVASFSISKQTGCTGDCLQFTNTSSGAPFTSISWTFQGGTPATSSSANPQVCYSLPGIYNVELKVTNVSGTNTVAKTGFITISTKSLAPVIEHKK